MSRYSEFGRKRTSILSLIGSFSLMLSLLLAGCGDSNRAKIVGIWEIETADKVLRRFKGDEFNSDDPAASRMKLEFRSGGTWSSSTTMGAIQGQKEGEWEWLSFDQDKSLAQLKFTIGLQTTEHEVQFIDEDTIELVPPNMAGLDMKVRYKRTR